MQPWEVLLEHKFSPPKPIDGTLCWQPSCVCTFPVTCIPCYYASWKGQFIYYE